MTHTKDEALDLALEALIHKANMIPVMQGNCYVIHPEAMQAVIDEAIKQALAAHVQPVGDWVWSWLMNWCLRNGIAPATQNSLFEMVKDARSKFDTTPPAAPEKGQP
jgi:hypothetical protein